MLFNEIVVYFKNYTKLVHTGQSAKPVFVELNVLVRCILWDLSLVECFLN